MKIEDLLTLCKAGFSAEQIATLTKEQKEPEPEPPKKKPEPEPEPPKNPPDSSAELLKAISALTAKIETMNIQNSHMQEKEQSVDDILASVIRPNGGAK